MRVTRSATTPLLRTLAASTRRSRPNTVAFACGAHRVRCVSSTKTVPQVALRGSSKPGSLKSERSFVGSEGLHYVDTSTKAVQEYAEETGDWVLFHPVYKDYEVKAVKVRYL